MLCLSWFGTLIEARLVPLLYYGIEAGHKELEESGIFEEVFTDPLGVFVADKSDDVPVLV